MITFYLFAIASVYTCRHIYFITVVFACLQKDGIIDKSCRDAADTVGRFLMREDCECPLYKSKRVCSTERAGQGKYERKRKIENKGRGPHRKRKD